MRARYAGTLGLLMAIAIPAVAQQPPVRRAPAQPRAAAPAPQAQRPDVPPMQRRAEQGLSPEVLLRMKEQLGLTEAQVTRLEALRQEGVTAQRNRMAERLEMQSKLRAGAITPEQLREQRQARAGQGPTAGQQALGERVRAVLTDQQRIRLAEQQVAQLRRRLEARQAPRGQAGRGAQRGGIGGQRGARGGNRPGIRGAVRPPRQGMTPGARGAAPEIRERMDAVRERMRSRMLPPDTATPPSQEPN